MISGEPPFKADNPIKLAKEIVEEEARKIEGKTWKLTSVMLEKKPKKRISTEDVLKKIRIERKYGKIIEALRKGTIINRELAEAYGDNFKGMVNVLKEVEGIVVKEGKIIWKGLWENVSKPKVIVKKPKQLTQEFIEKPIFKYKHGSYVESVAFSPDGRLIATGSGDYMLRVFLVVYYFR